MNWDRLMENYYGPLESYTEDFHPPEDIAIIKRGLVIHRTKELGYGVKGPEVWTVTAAGAMTTPALFFPTRQAADRYIEQNAGSEGSYVGATGSPEEADGPLGRALFGFGYFGAGEPEQYRIERHELETDHDGEHVWILRAATYNRVEWAVNVFATRSEAEQALRVQEDALPNWPVARGWGFPESQEQWKDGYTEEEVDVPFTIEKIQFGARWQIWDLD